MEKATYRLVWFQHFHKAAGSSIVDAAQLSGERCYPQHANGNPLGPDGQQLPLWDYTAAELLDFIDQCQQRQITFVATEWGLPNLAILSQDERVTLISCLRHPVTRLVSNFYFDLYLGYTPARDLESYVGSRNRTITMFNYYCRVLSGHDNGSGDITAQEFAVARNQLSKFDHVLVLENGMDGLASKLGWRATGVHTNKLRFGFRQFAGLLLRGKFRQLFIRLRYPRQEPGPLSMAYVEAGNAWDIRLYEEASMAAVLSK